MKRKTVIALLIAVFLFTYQSDAQILSGLSKDTTQPKIGFGLKAGLNMQTISGSIWDNGSQAGWNGGFFVRMYKNKLGGRAEVLISSNKISSPVITDSFGNKGDFRTTHIEVPVMVEYSVIPRLTIMAGGQYSNLTTVKNLTDITGDIKKIFKQSEFSAIVGVEVKLPYKIGIGARYRLGISNINNETISGIEGSWSTQAIQFYASYTIK